MSTGAGLNISFISETYRQKCSVTLVFRNVACLRGLLCRLPEAGAVSTLLGRCWHVSGTSHSVRR